MSSFADRAQSLLDDWPPGGRIVGVVMEPTDPVRSGQLVLDLVEVAVDAGHPALVLDLATGASGLGRRLGFRDRPGLAEVASGDARLWEVTRRDDARDLVYVPGGEVGPVDELLDSAAADTLAERSRGKDGLLLVLLGAEAAEDAASTEYLDDLVRIEPAGDRGRSPGRSAAGGGPAAPARPDGDPPAESDGPRLVLPPDMQSSRPWWRKRSVLAAAAIAAAVGLSALLGGPAPGDLADLVSGDRGASSGAPAVPADREGPDPAPAADASTPDSVAGPDTALAAGPEAGDAGSGDTAEAGGAASAAPEGDAVPAESGDAASSVPAGGGGPADAGDESLPTVPGPDPRSGPAAGELPAVNADVASFEAVSDSLARAVELYHRRAERLSDGAGSCGPVARAHERADRLFERLWLYHMSLQPEMDSAGRAEYRTRSRQMENVQRSFLLTDCSGPGGAGSGG